MYAGSTRLFLAVTEGDILDHAACSQLWVTSFASLGPPDTPGIGRCVQGMGRRQGVGG